MPPPASAGDRRFSPLSGLEAGTGPEAGCDDILALTRSVFGAPVALLTPDPQHGSANGSGCSAPDGPALLSVGPAIVPDLRDDPRFGSRPQVVEGRVVRFYAGARLAVPGRPSHGTLCIMDEVPRPAFGEAEQHVLSGLAALAAERLEARRAASANTIVRGFADTTSTAVLCLDGEGAMTFANRAALHLFGYPADQMIGHKLDRLMPERFRAAHAAGVARIAKGEAPKLAGKTVEIVALRKDGREFPAELAICSWRDESGVCIGATVRDVSERKERVRRLQRLAHHDTLTGLANRARIATALKECFADGESVGLLLIDLDGFKQVNDVLGHAAGDALLQSLALRLTTALDGDALLGRFGGDEFAVVLKRQGDPVAVARCADALLATFEAPFHMLGHELQVGASIGGAVHPGHGGDDEELMASADLALYRAKADGRQRFRLFEPAMRSALSARRALQDEIRLAVDRNELELFFQPQVDLRDKRLIGAEALLRWRHPVKGLLAPAAFLSALETHTLAAEVGTWILDEACRQAAAWREVGLTRLRVGLNLFAVQLRTRLFAQRVSEALARHGLGPDQLELEIVETIALQDDERVLGALRELRGLGVGLAFDDFGTGYAALSSLKRVPLTTLKIDRGFVRNLGRDAEDAAVVEAVVSMGRRLGVTVIAEGVETAAQEATLLAMGCDAAQGYRYGRPVPAAVFLQGIRRSTPGGATTAASNGD